jgi:hypothetical protein
MPRVKVYFVILPEFLDEISIEVECFGGGKLLKSKEKCVFKISAFSTQFFATLPSFDLNFFHRFLMVSLKSFH